MCVWTTGLPLCMYVCVYMCVFVCVCVCACVCFWGWVGGWRTHARYQPDQPSATYQMANMQEEVELSDGISAPSMGILPGVEERLN